MSTVPKLTPPSLHRDRSPAADEMPSPSLWAMRETEQLLNALLRHGDGLIELRALPSRQRAWIQPGDMANVQRFMSEHRHENVYFGVAARNDCTSGRLENCSIVRALYADLDFKNAIEAEARQALESFPLETSFIVHSGGGLHCYWILSRGFDLRHNSDSFKALLRSLARTLNADLSAAEPARVLRLPGSINWKREYPHHPHVRVETADSTRSYSLSDFEFLQLDEPEPNTENASRQAHLVDERIKRARAYARALPEAVQGEHGDLATYQAAAKMRDFDLTEAECLQVLADEFNPRCRPPWSHEDLQTKVSNAYRYAKGIPGSKPEQESPKGGSQQPEESADTLVLDPADPLPSAGRFAEQFHMDDGVLALRHQGGLFYRHQGARYREIDESSIRAKLYEWLAFAKCRQASKDEEDKFVPFKPNISKVSNVLDALRAVCNLPTSYAAPCWLDGCAGPDPSEIVACSNGLLHIPTKRLMPSTSRFFTLNGLEFAYDPHAAQPKTRLRFLNQIWPDDLQSRGTFQEWVGYLLTPVTRMQKMLLLIGPKRAGKGTIGRVIRMLLGEGNVCTPTLAGMAEPFGLASLIGKSAAIISDARISGRADTTIVAERLLSISGEDPQTVPRKFLPDWIGILSARFMLMTNELPKLEDASGTLASRFITLALTESFYGREDHGLLEKFVPELPGILLWALEGWEQLYRRGRFVQPNSSLELISQFEDLGSPIGAFVRDRCEVKPGCEVPQDSLFESWKSWCAENGKEHPGTIQVFGRNLQSFVPGLKVTRPRVMGVQVRYYTGIRLKTQVEAQ